MVSIRNIGFTQLQCLLQPMHFRPASFFSVFFTAEFGPVSSVKAATSGFSFAEYFSSQLFINPSQTSTNLYTEEQTSAWQAQRLNPIPAGTLAGIDNGRETDETALLPPGADEPSGCQLLAMINNSHR